MMFNRKVNCEINSSQRKVFMFGAPDVFFVNDVELMKESDLPSVRKIKFVP